MVDDVYYVFMVWSSLVAYTKHIAHNYVLNPFCRSQCLGTLGTTGIKINSTVHVAKVIMEYFTVTYIVITLRNTGIRYYK